LINRKEDEAMNNELQAILNYMERDRGIDREVLIMALESSIQAAARRSVTTDGDIRISIDRETFDIKAFSDKHVVEEVEDPETEISLDEAVKEKHDVVLGDVISREITVQNLGRIAAQTAKQAIMQKIRQAERDIVFEEYKDRVGDIVTGTVRQFNRGDIIIDLGRAEAVLPSKQRVPKEEYQVGDRIRAYIVQVQDASMGPSVVLSRSHPDFVRRLFELEVSEITENIVEIKGIAREPGYRTKLAVVSHDEKVDPVGACVGMRGLRVKNIVRELSGEKIDIIRWSEDIKTYVINSLSPAKLLRVEIDDSQEKTIHVTCDSEQLSLAIGKRGQNVRLSAKLIGWKIDIQRDENDISFEEKVERAVGELAKVEGIDAAAADKLVHAGFLTLDGILAVTASDLEEIAELDSETAATVHAAATAHQQTAEELVDQQ
jgi:N utilization substance protein A